LCDGTAVSRTTYADLFAIVGTSFGTGDGSSTFNLPNFKSRMPIGLDGADAAMDTIGEQGGSKTKNLQHTHGIGHTHSLSAHTHTLATSNQNDFAGSANDTLIVLGGLIQIATLGGSNPRAKPTDTTGGPSSDITGGDSLGGTSGTGLSTTQDVMNPFMTVNFIIKW
jgi:microcystin-dependent protein